MTTTVVEIPGAELVVGDTIDFFGELHTIKWFESNAGPLTEAELLPKVRIAVDGDWRMTVPDGKVPCLPRAGVAR